MYFWRHCQLFTTGICDKQCNAVLQKGTNEYIQPTTIQTAVPNVVHFPTCKQVHCDCQWMWWSSSYCFVPITSSHTTSQNDQVGAFVFLLLLWSSMLDEGLRQVIGIRKAVIYFPPCLLPSHSGQYLGWRKPFFFMSLHKPPCAWLTL